MAKKKKLTNTCAMADPAYGKGVADALGIRMRDLGDWKKLEA